MKYRRAVQFRDLFFVLLMRDLKLLYKRSFLGFGWALILPITQLFIYILVFRRVLSVDIEKYPVYVFIGVLLFGWFQSTLSESGGLITGNKVLVTQPGFPLVVLPHIKAGVRLFHFLIALPVLLVMLFSFDLRPSLCWVSLPVLMFIQYLLIVGISYPLASLNVRFRDTQHIVSVGLHLLMFLTPIFYSLDQVPKSCRVYFYLNPMVGILESWRHVLIDNRWPDITIMLSLLSVGMIMVVFGRYLFVCQSHRFVEEIS